MAPGYGLGVDNILEATIVLASGEIVTANANQNSDLYFAIRGGGGSTWGIITSITVKAHQIPNGGFTHMSGLWVGDFCNNQASMKSFVKGWNTWILDQTGAMGGYTFM